MWNSHITKRIQKAYISYEQCRRTIGKTWGFSPKVAMLTYAAIVWGHKASQIVNSWKLDHVQRMTCLKITGAMKTTLTRGLEVILGLTPLDIYVQEVALTTMFRFRTVAIEPSVGVGLQRARIWKEARTLHKQHGRCWQELNGRCNKNLH